MTEPQVVEGIHYRSGKHVRIEIEAGRIATIQETGRAESVGRASQAVQGANEPNIYVAPGLVDLQVNGYAGYDLNTPPLSTECVANLTSALWSEGVTSYYPTVITNSDAHIEQALRAIVRASEESPSVRDSVAGIHLEGPFISSQDGPRGAHPLAHVTHPDWSKLERWQEAAGGLIKIVTLSPEWPEAVEFIERCVNVGILVSIGHTAASPEQIHAAVSAGARCSTHLGNGSHLMLPRHRNYIWEQLACDDLWTCFIADGFHLPDSLQKVILRTKKARAIVVSDSVSYGGMEPGTYETHIGGKVVLTPEGKLHLADQPQILAGSAQALLHGLNQLVKKQLVTLEEAWDMGSIRPSTLMNLSTKDGLRVGAPADIVQFSFLDGSLHVVRTIKRGKPVSRSTRLFND